MLQSLRRQNAVAWCVLPLLCACGARAFIEDATTGDPSGGAGGVFNTTHVSSTGSFTTTTVTVGDAVADVGIASDTVGANVSANVGSANVSGGSEVGGGSSVAVGSTSVVGSSSVVGSTSVVGSSTASGVTNGVGVTTVGVSTGVTTGEGGSSSVTTGSSGTGGAGTCLQNCAQEHTQGAEQLVELITEFCGCQAAGECHAECATDSACTDGKPEQGFPSNPACGQCVGQELFKGASSSCLLKSATSGDCNQANDCVGFVTCGLGC